MRLALASFLCGCLYVVGLAFAAAADGAPASLVIIPPFFAVAWMTTVALWRLR